MANELIATYQTSNAVYAVVRRISDGDGWNTSTLAFETFVDLAANLLTYRVAMTAQGGDLYAADFPSAIPAGDYQAIIYEQAGAAPETTDTLITSIRLHWDGIAASNASTVTLSPYALTTLDSLKRHMHLTGNSEDTLLTELINSTSGTIENVTGRMFAARDYRQRYSGHVNRRIVLKHFPVQNFTRVAYGSANAITVTFNGAGIRANASVYNDPEQPDAGGIRLVTVSTAGVKSTHNLTFATYPSLSVMATAINAISGWVAVVLVNQPTADLSPTGGESALGRIVTFTYPDRDIYEYTVDKDKGFIEFGNRILENWGASYPYIPHHFPPQFYGILMEYRAGFETIPADVQLLCNDLAKEAYFLGKQNTSIKQSTLGPFSVTLRDNYQDYIRQRLSVYTDISQMIGGST